MLFLRYFVCFLEKKNNHAINNRDKEISTIIYIYIYIYKSAEMFYIQLLMIFINAVFTYLENICK